MLIDDIQRVVRERGGPVADTFGDAFIRELSFDDLGLEDLVAQDARILSLYFNRDFTNVGKKPAGKEKHGRKQNA